MSSYAYIGENLARIREACASRADALGVPAPRLIAVTKSAEADEVRALVEEFGQTAIAENRTSLFCERYEMFSDDMRPEMHLIGSLQTNKVKYIAGKTALIQSLDSLRLAAEIEKQAAKRDIRIRTLIEINSGREENKGGILPEDAPEFCRSIAALPHLNLVGLMTMAPHVEDPAKYHVYFSETRILAQQIFREILHREEPPVLSMGMSESYREAALEGASVVRVGRQLFRKPE